MALTAAAPRPESPGLSAGRPVGRQRASAPLFVVLFILSMPFPLFINIGSVTVFPYRILLLIALFPATILWISGQAGRIRLPDILFICFTMWAAMTFFIAQGVEGAVEPSGALFLETFGAYLLARVYIRDVSSFRAMARLLLIVVLVLLPLAVVESVTGRNIVLELLRPIGLSYAPYPGEPRWGLERAQTAFPHPILYGVFCAAAFSLTLYVVMMKRSKLARTVGSSLVALATFFSLSTGAYVAVWIQVLLAIWDAVTRRIRHRWLILGGLAAAAFATVSMFSNRTPFHVFITYLTFNSESSYNRILIWDYGTAEVMRNPLFGIGYGEFDRPWWMHASVDNFWLLIAMRHGLPAFFLFSAAILLIMYKIGRQKIDDPEIAACRAGLLISLGGLIIAAITVHFWTQLYTFFMFLVGSGVWMLDSKRSGGLASPHVGGDGKSELRSSRQLGRRASSLK